MLFYVMTLGESFSSFSFTSSSFRSCVCFPFIFIIFIHFRSVVSLSFSCLVERFTLFRGCIRHHDSRDSRDSRAWLTCRDCRAWLTTASTTGTHVTNRVTNTPPNTLRSYGYSCQWWDDVHGENPDKCDWEKDWQVLLYILTKCLASHLTP